MIGEERGWKPKGPQQRVGLNRIWGALSLTRAHHRVTRHGTGAQEGVDLSCAHCGRGIWLAAEQAEDDARWQLMLSDIRTFRAEHEHADLARRCSQCGATGSISYGPDDQPFFVCETCGPYAPVASERASVVALARRLREERQRVSRDGADADAKRHLLDQLLAAILDAPARGEAEPESARVLKALAIAEQKLNSICCLAFEGPDAFHAEGKPLRGLVEAILKEAKAGYDAAHAGLAKGA